jgi:hypothetical protein
MMGGEGTDGSALDTVTFACGIVTNSDDRFVFLGVCENGPGDGRGRRGSRVSVAFPEVAERIA